jgi:hypothetical protein
MAQLSQVVGLLLMVVGVAGYFASGVASPTALIPAAFGLVIWGVGYLAKRDIRRQAAMHVAMIVALLGIAGSIRGLASLPVLLTGGDVARPLAVVSQSVMAVVLIVYLAKGIQSFRAARRARVG